MRGRRLAYLNPIRMYIFTSAIFFLIIFNFFTKGLNEEFEEGRRKEMVLQTAKLALAAEKNPVKIDSLKKIIADADSFLIDLKDAGFVETVGDSIKKKGDAREDSLRPHQQRIGLSNDIASSVAEYDSIQNSLPENKRDGFFRRYVQRRAAAMKEKYEGRRLEMWEKVTDKSIHSLPAMMMVSLPFFAFILFVLYLRNRQLYFVDHLIFTLHLYIAQYVNLLVLLTIGSFQEWSGWKILNWLFFAQVLAIFFYLYKSMRNFYGQSRRKTIVKYAILNIGLLIIFTLLFVSMVVNSLLSI